MHLVQRQGWVDQLQGRDRRALEELLEFFDRQTRVVDVARAADFRRVVGAGAFATVLLGTARASGRPFALKKLTRGNGTPMEKMLRDFRSECEMMARLRHPNIITLLGTTKEPIGLVMEYCSRGSLFQLLADTDIPLNWPTKKKMAAEVASGMQYLHSQQIIHRDLKSLNILITDNWNIKVTDFGLSRFKATTASDKMTGQAGTYHWMAPEVINSEFYTEKADVYSFGIILWEIYTRGVPFDGMQPVQVVAAVVNRGERPRIPLHCPETLAQLIRLCWHLVPTHRPGFDAVVGRLGVM